MEIRAGIAAIYINFMEKITVEAKVYKMLVTI